MTSPKKNVENNTLFPYFTEYDARKVCSSREEMIAQTEEFRAGAPDWFRFEHGFRFVWDGSPAVLLGFGGHRKYDFFEKETVVNGQTAYRLEFKPVGIVFSYLYKGEWHLLDMTRSGDDSETPRSFWKDVKPAE